jgi:hypothetical protein
MGQFAGRVGSSKIDAIGWRKASRLSSTSAKRTIAWPAAAARKHSSARKCLATYRGTVRSRYATCSVFVSANTVRTSSAKPQLRPKSATAHTAPNAERPTSSPRPSGSSSRATSSRATHICSLWNSASCTLLAAHLSGRGPNGSNGTVSFPCPNTDSATRCSELRSAQSSPRRTATDGSAKSASGLPVGGRCD